MIKHFIATVTYLAISLYATAQLTIDSTVNLDLLASPASPAFNILGISLNDVERPTDIGSFSLSVQEATNNFTRLPQSYAFQVAPFLLGKRKYTLNEFDNGAYAFKQSFEISAGYTHQGPKGLEDVDSLKTTKLGLGIKFSIVRPQWTGATRKNYTNLVAAQQALLAAYHALEEKQKDKRDRIQKDRNELKELEATPTLSAEEKARFAFLVDELNTLEEEMNEEANSSLVSTAAFDQAKKAATSVKSERKGFFLDFSGGFALDFPGNRFNNSKVYRGGIWFTGGHENGNSGLSVLAIARYLYNPETIFADSENLLKGDNVSTFDMGARMILDASQQKLSFSTEAIYRSVLGNERVKPSWRLVFNAGYDIGFNKKISFAFGRDFDGTISKGGNLVAALNFIAGFGTDRKISNK